MAEFAEKTEAPTPKRREKAAEEGQVLRSRELTAAAVVLAGVLWLALSGPTLIRALEAVMRESFQFGRADVEDFQPLRPILSVGLTLAPSLVMLFAVTTGVSVLSQAGLGGISFQSKLLGFKGARLNPGAGLKRIFGFAGWIELGKGLMKVALLGSIGVWMLWSMRQESLGLVAGNVESSVAALGWRLVMLLLVMSGGLLLIAGIDVPIQFIRLLNKLKMSKQEIKDEHKQAEGSPESKAAQRRRMFEIFKQSARKSVGTAHVVLTNPTHFAVALRYERGQDEVPVVVAKGRGAKALAIRELAQELEKPVLEYPALARAVYYTSREGQQVRDDLYVAIATVLAFVFGVNLRAGGGQPNVIVPDSALFDENGVRVARA
ncbi:flagellar biosynthesis protein FlhB [Sphingomonas changbaiensis NBRC 104936]|uniref:Flagellar biosynthesis protein FlhB n=1 Tax=Sphingomonas changbaiensis NBRC 104936 TaxID=1219043 RepID=A0A0E9MTT9_9SPHN|nr:flagellar type III secretion system protein FlhB [Sphingomonas changbaiensis]GAO40545.1 flagellar biosynthesis protein FlhB [Sphingomonas changbaiensis NBRC 104936]